MESSPSSTQQYMWSQISLNAISSMTSQLSIGTPLPSQSQLLSAAPSSTSMALSQEQKERICIKKELAMDQLKLKHPKKARAAQNREKAIATRSLKQYQKERSSQNR